MVTSRRDKLNDQVRSYWEQEPCGTGPDIVGGLEPRSRDWFERVEDYRYQVEPFIHSVAQFSRHHGKRILGVGVGAGTDHLQWARVGAERWGVDLTDAAIELTRARLALYGFHSNLRRMDAEILPFEGEYFDLVYSWGVIHHSEQPQKILHEIHRVLRPGGLFLGMMYGRHSVAAFRVWIRFALLRGRPWQMLGDALWDAEESVGTKAYTVAELRELFSEFEEFSAEPILTHYDTRGLPRGLRSLIPRRLGWFIALRVRK